MSASVGAREGTINLEELELVEGLRARQEEAVSAFLERYRSLFYHCIGHFESDAGSREDLYQDLVLYVLERLDGDRFDPEKGSFGTWLYRVAWCRCVDLKRKEGARRRPKLATVGEDIPEREDEAPGPAESVGTSEISGFVREAMDALEPEERSLLELRFVQGQTLGDISNGLSISLEQTKYRLRRATISLRRVLLNQYALEEAHE
ncbi:MAG: sigma-70 family RNA polymerase sigma factor [bacterium]|nr:sigma-70 family RNA polymerase sigma factor [bacterium]